MLYKMSLTEELFNKIKNNEKTMEVRLNDDKRKT